MMEGIEQMLRDGLEKMKEDIIAKSRAAGQEASGRTYRAMEVKTRKEGDSYIGELYAPVYFHTLLVGRGPGKVPANMGQLIMDWAAVKGITFKSPQEAVRFGNAVAWKIRREGTEMYRTHRHEDLVSIPSYTFEEWLDKKIGGVMDSMIEASFLSDYRR